MITSSFLALLLGSSAISSTLAGAAFQVQQTFLRSSTTTIAVVRQTALPGHCYSPRRTALRCNLESGDDASCGRHDALPDRESLACDRNFRSSRRVFLGRVAAGFGATTAAVVALGTVSPTASFAVASRSAEEVKKAIEEDFVSRCSAV